ncbi:MAG: phosphatase PAP2 family protein [Oscillibacter sp.]|nr:phosphatase PAP2 family protein [Oscillibacter sp.]
MCQVKKLSRHLTGLCRSFPWGELRYALWLPVYLISFAVLEHLPFRPYWATQLPLDDYIPFCSWFVLAYDAWFAFLLGTGIALLLAGKRTEYRRYMRLLGGTFLTAAALWVVLPNGQDLRPVHPAGALAGMVEALYRIDTNTNVFPSLHVAGAVGAAIAVRDGWGRTRPWLCRSADALAALICVSTVCIKQHSVLDVGGGIAFCAAGWCLVYSPAARRGEAVIRRVIAERAVEQT